MCRAAAQLQKCEQKPPVVRRKRAACRRFVRAPPRAAGADASPVARRAACSAAFSNHTYTEEACTVTARTIPDAGVSEMAGGRGSVQLGARGNSQVRTQPSIWPTLSSAKLR